MADPVDPATVIGLLDDDSTDVAEGAKVTLMGLGPVVLPHLVAAVGSLGRYGQLSAIEVFEHFGDAAAGPALIDLLGSDDTTVREWAAIAVAGIGVPTAVPALRAAYRDLLARGDGLDWTEAVALRHALADLGGRRPVLPPLAASLCTSVGTLETAWPADRLAEVVDDLAGHGQAVLYFLLWSIVDGGTFSHGHESLDTTFDLRAPWPQVVAATREAALIEAAFVVPRPNLFATVEWIDRADLTP